MSLVVNEILARTDKWLLIEDFLDFMLCGRRATDYSMASCTLLFDQRRLAWSEEMLQAAGIPRSLMPDAFPAGTVLGKVTPAAAKATGLLAGTPVVLPDGRRMIPAGHWKLFEDTDLQGTFPFSALWIPGTKWVTVSDDGYEDHALRVIDTSKLEATITQRSM